MTKPKKWICALLCTAFAFSAVGCSSDGPTIATVNGQKITNAQYRQIFDFYAKQYGLTDPTSEDNADTIEYLQNAIVDMLIDEEVQMQKAREMGLDALSTEEEAQVDTQVTEMLAYWKQQFTSIVQLENADLSEEELAAKADEEVQNYLTELGYTQESLRADLRLSFILSKLSEATTADVSVSDEAVQEAYEGRVEEIRGIYADDPSVFETDYHGGTTLYYTPKGFRRVKHILIAMDETDATEISTLRTAGSENEANAKRKEALSKIQQQAQQVRDQIVADGSNFDDIMAHNSDDPGSTERGYAVCKENSSFDTDFVDGVFALKKPGAISGLIPSDYGYHIVYYIEDLKEGVTPLADVQEALRSELLETARSDAYNDLVEQWREAATVQTMLDQINYDSFHAANSEDKAAS